MVTVACGNPSGAFGSLTASKIVAQMSSNAVQTRRDGPISQPQKQHTNTGEKGPCRVWSPPPVSSSTLSVSNNSPLVTLTFPKDH
jgi:hypothetical protein